MFYCIFIVVVSHIAWIEAVERECGLPKNLNSLPDFAREEIREIWRNYLPGTPCLKQLEIESDIFDVIKSFDSDSSTNTDRADGTDSRLKLTTGTVDYDHLEERKGTPIPLFTAKEFSEVDDKKLRTFNVEADDYLDQTTFDDVAMMQFDTPRAPFLRTANSHVKDEFQKIWNDKDIPSESLRTLKIQMLAVSLLSSKQLVEYNRWATKRRRVLKAREQEMKNLSVDARQALRKLSVQRDDVSTIVVPAEVKQELTTFVQKLNRRRSLKLVH